MSSSDDGTRTDAATTDHPSGQGGTKSGMASATTERPVVTTTPDPQDEPAGTGTQVTRPMKPGSGSSNGSSLSGADSSSNGSSNGSGGGGSPSVKNGSTAADAAAARAVAAGGSATKPTTPSPATSRPAVKPLVTNTPGSAPVPSTPSPTTTGSPSPGSSASGTSSPSYGSGRAASVPPGYAPTAYEAPAEQRPEPSPVSAPAGASVATAAGTAGGAGPRTARLTIASVDPWSVLKLSFLLSVAFGIALVVASVVLWSVLNGMGVFESVNSTLGDIGGKEAGFDIYSYVGLGRVVSLSVVVAVVNVVLITALSTLGGFLYNLGAGLVGGLHVTLSDD